MKSKILIMLLTFCLIILTSFTAMAVANPNAKEFLHEKIKELKANE